MVSAVDRALTRAAARGTNRAHAAAAEVLDTIRTDPTIRERVLSAIVTAYTGGEGYGDDRSPDGLYEWMHGAADAVVGALVESDGAWSWTPPAEPGPHVRRVRRVDDDQAGGDTVWFDRIAAGRWRIVLRGQPAGVVPWRYVIALNNTMYGGRTLVDATAEREG